jgi:hypothetical protein
MLESDDNVVGVSDHDHVARGLPPSPALGPEVECVVEVDVRERCPVPLPSTFTMPSSSTLARSHLDEPDNAPIADPMFVEADHPLLGDFREERPDVSVARTGALQLPVPIDDDLAFRLIPITRTGASRSVSGVWEGV